jgi:hypothetical protein
VKKPLIIASTVAALSLAIVGVVAVNNASAAVTTYTVALNGANEVPPGDMTNYTGNATITIDSVTFQVCVVATLNTQGVTDPVIANHIHQGAVGVAGAIFVPLGNMSFPSLNSCVTADASTTAAIIANPSGFYYNIHTTMHTGGAARGQLVLQAAGTTTASTTSTTSAVSPTIATVAPVAAANPTFTG